MSDAYKLRSIKGAHIIAVTVKPTFAKAFALVRGRLLALALFSLVFKAIHFAMLAPLATWSLRIFLQRWGRASVGNSEIASFLLSPVGLLAICCVGGITAATLYLEIAGLMQIMLKPSFHWWNNRSQFLQLFHRLVRLGMIQLTISLAIVLPFAAVIYAIYAALWMGRDLNGLLILKPAEFWWGAGLAAMVLLVMVSLLLILYLQWLLAVAILLCQPDCSPLGALSTSRKIAQQHTYMIAKCIAVWFIVQIGVSFSVWSIVHFGLLQVLDTSWQSLSTAALVTGLTLTTESLVGALLSIFSNIGFAAIVLAIYESVIGADFVQQRSQLCESLSQPHSRSPLERFVRRWWLAGAPIALMTGALAVSYWICDTLKLKDPIAITAHRAGAAFAPENTIAAVRRAIEDKADWAEIDVQLTADDELVVLHDTDLARMGGGTAAVGKSTLAQIQSLDVGSLFSAEYQGERVPRFSDFLEVAKGKIRLNVELKPHGTADTRQLTSKVIAAIQAAEMVSQCRICSQSYEGIQLARTLEPSIEIGFIAATAIGDSTRLNVNFLMLSHSKITRLLVERAQLRGVKIHAWTVNDPKLVLKLVDAGVSNIITDNVVQITRQLKAIEALHPIERLLLRAKNGMTSNVSVPTDE